MKFVISLRPVEFYGFCAAYAVVLCLRLLFFTWIFDKRKTAKLWIKNTWTIFKKFFKINRTFFKFVIKVVFASIFTAGYFALYTDVLVKSINNLLIESLFVC